MKWTVWDGPIDAIWIESMKWTVRDGIDSNVNLE
jgi:hypothetical protein